MTDVVSPQVRSRMMSGIRGKNTRPELLIRRSLHRLGYRYRLHSKKLPGKPDLVLPRYRAVIFVNGCFWHGHDCHLFRWPSSRAEWWRAKITRTRATDAASRQALAAADWRILDVWECALKGRTRQPLEQVIGQIDAWLPGAASTLVIRGRDEDAAARD